MTLDFGPLLLEQQTAYEELYRKCPQPASDYTFVNLWGWAEEYGLSWAWQDDLVWIQQTRPQKLLWAPIGDWQAIDWQERCANLAERRSFVRVPEKLMMCWREQLGDVLTVATSREHWDYLYSTRELIDLKGNRFHAKKNKFSQFVRKHSFQYLPMDSSMVAQTLCMQEDWCAWRNCEASAGLIAEDKVIKRILLDWGSLDSLLGGLLIIDKKVAAFTVGEIVGDATMVIHLEKGIAKYNGIYQAINKLFLENAPFVPEVNREQDLGNLGLRKAKKSYHPKDFLRKYTVQIVP